MTANISGPDDKGTVGAVAAIFLLGVGAVVIYRQVNWQKKRKVFVAEHRERIRDYSGWEARQRARYR